MSPEHRRKLAHKQFDVLETQILWLYQESLWVKKDQ